MARTAERIQPAGTRANHHQVSSRAGRNRARFALPTLLQRDDVLALQRMIGNQAVQRLLATSESNTSTRHPRPLQSVQSSIRSQRYRDVAYPSDPTPIADVQRNTNPASLRAFSRGTEAIQTKRARPEESEARKTYDQLEPTYNEALTKGQGYLAALGRRRGNLLYSGEKPWEISEKLYQSMQEIFYGYDTDVDFNGEEDGLYYYTAATTNPSDEGNFYNNNITLPTGEIHADNNEAGDNPTPPSNSEVLWYQYSLALEHYNENRQQGEEIGGESLSQISRETIINDTTNEVIWMVYDSDDQVEKTVAADSEDGQALLGTPNGKSAVWLLFDHLEEVGGDKGITDIRLHKKIKKGKSPKQNMDIRIG